MLGVVRADHFYAAGQEAALLAVRGWPFDFQHSHGIVRELAEEGAYDTDGKMAAARIGLIVGVGLPATCYFDSAECAVGLGEDRLPPA